MNASRNQTLRIGTRGSLLARMQSQTVADAIEKIDPTIRVELTVIKTTGDAVTDRPLSDLGGKGLFVKELEQALLDEQIDLAVHSFKDVPVTMPLVAQYDLAIAAVPTREDASDALVSLIAPRIVDLPMQARVGTGSLRRRCQLLSHRPDLRVELIRGNIDTRIGKMRDGEFDALVLAMAGLRRSGLFDAQITFRLEMQEMLPAPGQGALALQCRRQDERTLGIVAPLNDPATAESVSAERSLVKLLKGDCFSPIGAFAEMIDGGVRLSAVVGARGGDPPVLRATAEAQSASAAADAVHRLLQNQGVQHHLHGHE
jgi:hydroxymethylbilane synthase